MKPKDLDLTAQLCGAFPQLGSWLVVFGMLWTFSLSRTSPVPCCHAKPMLNMAALNDLKKALISPFSSTILLPEAPEIHLLSAQWFFSQTLRKSSLNFLLSLFF